MFGFIAGDGVFGDRHSNSGVGCHIWSNRGCRQGTSLCAPVYGIHGLVFHSDCKEQLRVAGRIMMVPPLASLGVEGSCC